MKQLRIGSLAHHHASLRDNILRLEDQHPSPSATPPRPDSPFLALRHLPKNRPLPSSEPFLYETFPPPRPFSHRRVILSILHSVGSSSDFRWTLHSFLVPPRLSLTKNWAVFASACARECVKSSVIGAVFHPRAKAFSDPISRSSSLFSSTIEFEVGELLFTDGGVDRWMPHGAASALPSSSRH